MGIEPIRMFPTPCPNPCGEGEIGACRPHHRHGGLLAGGAALAFLIERAAEAANDLPAHCRGVAEADFGLGRVDVDVDLLERNVDEEDRDWVAVAGDEVTVSGA